MKQWQNLTDMFKDDDDVSDEMIKKYKNTVLGIKIPTVTVFATFVGFADNGMFLFKTKEQHTIKLSNDTEAEIFIPNPEKGLYNSPKGALFFQRHPKRQWKRGLNGENTQIFNVHIDFLPNTMIGGGNSFAYNWPFVLEEEGTKLWSMEEREAFIKERIHLHSEALFATDTNEDLPPCTPEECWEKPTTYAVKKEGGVRAKSVHTTKEEAESALESTGKGYFLEVRAGERTRCAKFCQVSPWCKQYKDYLGEQAK